MQVWKLGGASVNSLERIKALPGLLAQAPAGPLVVIVSAMGKTTNALEKVAQAFFEGRQADALGLFEQIKNQHLNTVKYLLVQEALACENQLQDFFTEVEWLLHDKPVRPFDYYYDQIVCSGELMSTAIVAHFLKESGTENTWVDVRDVLRTDNQFRQANIDWEHSSLAIQKVFANNPHHILLTQGFIGATADNESTTLGREGSDYSAAVFAHVLGAESLTIWKDVAAVMSADPKIFPDAAPLPRLSFMEVIEMAYYGAQVIHPKTIKPLQNKGIPLLVRCFLDPNLPGTRIDEKGDKQLPPIVVIKKNQVLLHLQSRDYSFVGEAPMSQLYQWLGQLHLTPNLVQTGAVGISLCLDDQAEKIMELAGLAAEDFEVMVEKGLELLTIRHASAAIWEAMTKDKSTVLQQETPETKQRLYRL
ncbi:MAG: aspartate kinase [Sphingobacteriia bacterium]|nr:MAG: aspartate kinase [Sphingobacteriia bacterium]